MDYRETNNYIYEAEDGALFADDYYYSLNKTLFNLLYSGNVKEYYVTGKEISTLPYISNKLYGTPDYWFLLAIINGISNILTPVPKNTIIFYFEDSDITTYLQTLASIQTTSDFTLPKSNKYINGVFTF